MSEFLIVVPEGWTEVTADWIGVVIELGDVTFWIAQEAWQDLENILGPRGELPDDQHVLGAKLVSLDDGYHLWVRFG